MLIRRKVAEDAEHVAELARDVRWSDRYPRYLPRDLARFMTPEYESVAWVAEADAQLIGHVALHRAASDPTLPAATRATRQSADGLTVLARLVVSPRVRHQGVGRALLEVAVAHARGRGQRVVLDVVQDSGAVGFYEALGWQRVEPLRIHLDQGRFLDLWVYIDPGDTDQSL